MGLGVVLATIYWYFAVFLAFFIGWLLQFIFMVLIGWMLPWDWRIQVNGLLFRGSTFVFCILLNPFWSVRLHYRYKGKIPKRAIFMSNHISFADAFVLCRFFAANLREAKFIAKAGVFDYPIAGWALRNQGDLPVYFQRRPEGGWMTKPGTVEAMFRKVDKYLAHKIPIMVFPEGTLSQTGEMRDFKPGFFEAAIRNNVPIVPLAFFGNIEAWPRNRSYVRPARIDIGVGEPIYPKEGESVEDLMGRVRAGIKKVRNSLPAYKRNPNTLSVRNPMGPAAEDIEAANAQLQKDVESSAVASSEPEDEADVPVPPQTTEDHEQELP